MNFVQGQSLGHQLKRPKGQFIFDGRNKLIMCNSCVLSFSLKMSLLLVKMSFQDGIPGVPKKKVLCLMNNRTKAKNYENYNLYRINWRFACFVQFFDDMLPNNQIFNNWIPIKSG